MKLKKSFMKKQKGVVFFMTLILLGIAVLICSASTLMVLQDTYTAKRIKYSSQAHYLAEAGVEEVIGNFTDNFDFAPSGYPKTLGSGSEGSYEVSVSVYPNDPNRKLITSTGTVNGVSKSIKFQIRYNGPPAFSYPAMGMGRLWIAAGSVVKDDSGAPAKVHSNSTSVGTSHNPSNAAVCIGGLSNDHSATSGRVEGNASACGATATAATVAVYDGITHNGLTLANDGSVVTGTITANAAQVPPPPFDNNFFQWYYNAAVTGGTVINGDVTFRTAGDLNVFNNTAKTNPNHIVYVKSKGTVGHSGYQPGNVDFELPNDSTTEYTGCLVTDGDILINYIASVRLMTQHQPGATAPIPNLPAFLCKGDIAIWDPTNIEGMVYSGGLLQIRSLTGGTGCIIYGSLYASGGITIQNTSTLHYVKPHPPGLPAGTYAVTIVSWSEQ